MHWKNGTGAIAGVGVQNQSKSASHMQNVMCWWGVQHRHFNTSSATVIKSSRLEDVPFDWISINSAKRSIGVLKTLANDF